MTTQNPIGLFIQAQGKNASECATLIQHIKQANYSTVSVMDNFQLCRDIKNAIPDCVVIHRDSNFEPFPSTNNPKTIIDYLTQLQQDKRIVVMVNCEQGFDVAHVNMWSDMIIAASAIGWHLCVGNTSSGSVKCGQGSDPNEWLTTGKRLLETIAANPGHYLGVHNYTSCFQWIVANGGWGNPTSPPAAIDWTKPQWHMGRGLQGIQAALKAFNITMNHPFMVITEGTFDQMDDLKNNPDNPYRNIPSNRWRMLSQKWNEWYPNRNIEDVLADQNIWTWEKVFAPSKFVVGIHFFTYWDASGQWADDRVDNCPIYLKRMEAYRGTVVPIPPVVTPPPPTPKTVTIPLSVLTSLRQELQGDVDTLRRYELQLATLSDDMTSELEVIDELIRQALSS